MVPPVMVAVPPLMYTPPPSPAPPPLLLSEWCHRSGSWSGRWKSGFGPGRRPRRSPRCCRPRSNSLEVQGAAVDDAATVGRRGGRPRMVTPDMSIGARADVEHRETGVAAPGRSWSVEPAPVEIVIVRQSPLSTVSAAWRSPGRSPRPHAGDVTAPVRAVASAEVFAPGCTLAATSVAPVRVQSAGVTVALSPSSLTVMVLAAAAGPAASGAPASPAPAPIAKAIRATPPVNRPSTFSMPPPPRSQVRSQVEPGPYPETPLWAS